MGHRVVSPLPGCRLFIVSFFPQRLAAASWCWVSFGKVSLIFEHTVMSGAFGVFLAQFLRPPLEPYFPPQGLGGSGMTEKVTRKTEKGHKGPLVSLLGDSVGLWL